MERYIEAEEFKRLELDVVPVETVKEWLIEQAKLNQNCVLNGDFSNACMELASNIDELRRFAKERTYKDGTD